jgi:hypothetical protein
LGSEKHYIQATRTFFYSSVLKVPGQW